LITYGGTVQSTIPLDITKSKGANGIHHLRFTWELNGLLKVYIDGKMVVSSAYTSAMPSPVKILIGNSGTDFFIGKLSDVHISNIDRGSLFPNLPADVISGDAVIMPAYTDQRKINSEAQMSQTTTGIAKGAGTGHNRGITATQATTGIWASGDTIKVTGIAGELVSGVFDTDTALARVVEAVTASNTVKVDDVSKLAVGDIVGIISSDWIYLSSKTINAIDVETKIITLNSTVTLYPTNYFVEITASSSVPLVNFLASGTKTAVIGSWDNTISNVRTFTLGTNATLTNQDIQLDYSLQLRLIPEQ